MRSPLARFPRPVQRIVGLVWSSALESPEVAATLVAPEAGYSADHCQPVTRNEVVDALTDRILTGVPLPVFVVIEIAI